MQAILTILLRKRHARCQDSKIVADPGDVKTEKARQELQLPTGRVSD